MRLTGAQRRRRNWRNPHGPRRCGHNPQRFAPTIWACRPKKVPFLVEALRRLDTKARHQAEWFRELLKRRTYINDGRTKDAQRMRPSPTVEETRSPRHEAHFLLLRIMISRCVMETMEVGVWKHGTPAPLSLGQWTDATGLSPWRVDNGLQDLCEGDFTRRAPREPTKRPDGSYQGHVSRTFLTERVFLALGFTEVEIKAARDELTNRAQYRRSPPIDQRAAREVRALVGTAAAFAVERYRADYDPIGSDVPEADRGAYNGKLAELRRQRPDDDPDRLRREAVRWLAELRGPPPQR